jgi:hypothetical protein
LEVGESAVVVVVTGGIQSKCQVRRCAREVEVVWPDKDEADWKWWPGGEKRKKSGIERESG